MADESSEDTAADSSTSSKTEPKPEQRWWGLDSIVFWFTTGLISYHYDLYGITILCFIFALKRMFWPSKPKKKAWKTVIPKPKSKE